MVGKTEKILALNTSLPNDKISDWSILKAFADEKNKCDEKLKFVLVNGRKHSGKRKKEWLPPAFSPFPTMFSKGFFVRVVKSQDCVVKS